MLDFMNLNSREKWFAATAFFFGALFVGTLCAVGFGASFKWEAISALATVLAVVLAIVGYQDAKRNQVLEYRSYLQMDFVAARFVTNGCFKVDIRIRNSGRTPAHHVACVLTVVCEREPGIRNGDFKVATAKFDIVNDVVEAHLTSDGGFPHDVQASVEDGVWRVKLLGNLVYFDEFGDKRENSFPFAFSGRAYYDVHTFLKPNFEVPQSEGVNISE